MATYYWVGGSGTWDNSSKTNWATSTGGAGGFGPPTSADTVDFDANSGTAVTVIVTSTATSLSTTVNKSDITLSLNGSPTLCQPTGTLTLTAGTINLNGNSLTVGIFSSNYPNTRTLTSSTPANIYLTSSTSATVWSIATPTNYVGSTNITVNVTGNDAVTKTIRTGAITANNACNFVLGGNGTTFSVAGDMITNNLTITDTTITSFTSQYAVSIYGNFTVDGPSPSIGPFYGINLFGTAFQTITTNGATLDTGLVVSGIGGTFQLQDNLTFSLANGRVRLTNGTLDLNGKTLDTGSSFQTATGTKNLTFNGGTLVCPAASSTAFYNIAPSGFTTTAGTGVGKISMTAASVKSFIGGGSIYNCTLENAGAGALTISGSNTFDTISNSVQPTTFTFTSGFTQTVANFNVSGTSGNLVTINTTGAVRANLAKSSGIVQVRYCAIINSNATGGAIWQAHTIEGNIDNGNNLGWLFAFNLTFGNVTLGQGIQLTSA